jgi:hypothetical protein
VKHKHIIAVETDEGDDVKVSIGAGGGWWFKVLHSWIDMGWWAWMSEAPKTVLIVLAKHANAERMCWPGLDLLIRESGLAKTAIYSSLNQLEAYGLVRRHCRGGGTTKTVYELRDTSKHAPAKGRVRGDGLVRPGGKVRPSGLVRGDGPGPESAVTDADSAPAESAPYRRNRSTSEPINRIRELEGGRTGTTAPEPACPLDGLTDAELAALKEVVVQQASESLRPFLVRGDPRKHPILRASMMAALAAC